MDINAIKSKLAAMDNQSSKREKIDYEKIFWKPANGSHQIRIVPSKFNRAMPFKELLFHYGIGKYPMIALSNFGEQDPIVEFVNELKKSSDKDSWSLAGKLSPKMRVFAPVVVRGEEDKGVRLWGFGKEVYKTLLQLAEDEDVGDYTDLTNGFDIKVNITPGNPYPSTTVNIKPKMSPLSDNNTLVDLWLKEQPDPIAGFSRYDYDFIKKQLQSWLNPDAEQAEESPAPQVQPVIKAPAPVSDFTLEAVQPKSNVIDKFDELFTNDLPF